MASNMAVINTAISAYYYLRLIVVMFFRERTTHWLAPKIPAAVGVALLADSKTFVGSTLGVDALNANSLAATATKNELLGFRDLFARYGSTISVVNPSEGRG